MKMTIAKQKNLKELVGHAVLPTTSSKSARYGASLAVYQLFMGIIRVIK